MAMAMKPEAGRSGGMPLQALAPISLSRIAYWAWQTVSVSRERFGASVLLSILVQQLSQYKSQLLVTVIALLAAGGTGSLSGPSGTGGFLAAIVPRALTSAALLFAFLAVAVVVLQFADRVLAASTDQMMLGRLQQRLHDRLLLLGAAFHQRTGLSDSTMIVTRYAMIAQSLLREVASFPFVRGLSLVTAMMYLLDNLSKLGNPPAWVPVLLLAIVVLFPIAGWKLSGMLRPAFQQSALAEMALAKEFANSAVLPLEIQAMGAGEQRSASFAAKVAEAVAAKVRAAMRNQVAQQFENAVPDIIQAGLMVYGVYQTLGLANAQDRIAAGAAIVGVIQFVPLVIAPVREMIGLANMVNSQWPQVEMSLQVLEAVPEMAEPADARALPNGALPVTLRNIVYQPPTAAAKILDNISLNIGAGEIWGLVGRSGSGKSTILNLIARLREFQAGSLLLGDIDIKEARFASLRHSIGLVSQFPLIMNDSARANLALAKPDADDAAMETVCRSAGVWEALLKAAPPGGSALDTQLYTEPSKGTLSGGQRRLFAIARALLNEPGILLLDEPTTGVDNLTRLPLEEVIRTHAKARTVIMVDQDMGFVAALSGKIACLDNGKVADVLTKDEFLTKPSLFLQLYQASQREDGHMRVVTVVHEVPST